MKKLVICEKIIANQSNWSKISIKVSVTPTLPALVDLLHQRDCSDVKFS